MRSRSRRPSTGTAWTCRTRWTGSRASRRSGSSRGGGSFTRLAPAPPPPLVTDPPDPEPFPFDREYTLVLDDWATGTGRPLSTTREGTAGGRGGMGGMMGRMGGMMGGMMCLGGIGGMMGGSQAPAYDTMTINGKAYPATQPLTVRKGERVRLRLINASAEHSHVVRL